MFGRHFHNARRKTGVRMWSLLLTVCLSGCIVLGDNSSNILRLNTRCAPGYSEEAFKTIEVGDSEEKVLDLLGNPLERSSDVNNPAREYLWYTKPIGPSENYLLRNIVIEGGEVVRVYSEDWWD
jgi:hypothetical protein